MNSNFSKHKELINEFFSNFSTKRPNKILLLTLDSPFLDNKNVFPYLGILYLLSVAKNEGLRVKYLDKSDLEEGISERVLNSADVFYSDEITLDNVKHFEGFDLIGISCMTPQGKEANEILYEFKLRFPQTKVMIGGPHANHYTKICKGEGYDLIIRGDGERIFKEILCGESNSLASKVDSMSDESCLILMDSLNEAELNQWPLPLREAKYIKKYRYLLEGSPATTIVNSRGCPMACTFCEDRRTIGRWYSVQHLNAELEEITRLGINRIMFFDDLFAVSLKKLIPYAELLKKFHQRYGLVYRCFGHANAMDREPEIASVLAESGCVEMGFGAESADQRILDTIGKGTKVYQLHKFINTSIQAGIKVKAFFMLGLPGETFETAKNTEKFIIEYRKKYPEMFDFDLSVYFPYRGTVIGEVARLKPGEKFQINSNNIVERTYYKIRIREELSWEEIDNGTYGAYKKKKGASDIVIESYDWETGKVLLSADEMQQIKNEFFKFSARYFTCQNNTEFPVEGNIGAQALKTTKKV